MSTSSIPTNTAVNTPSTPATTTAQTRFSSSDQRFETRSADDNTSDEDLATGPSQGDSEGGNIFEGIVGADNGADHDEDSRREEEEEREFSSKVERGAEEEG